MIKYIDRVNSMLTVFAAILYVVYPSEATLGMCLVSIGIDLMIINRRVKNSSCWY